MQTDAQLKTWVTTWQQAGVALEEVRRNELRALDENPDGPAIDALLQWALEHAAETTTSGLVEQQRFFKRLRSQA